MSDDLWISRQRHLPRLVTMDNVLTFLLVVLLCGLQVAASDPDKASGRDNAIVTETLQPPFKTLSKTGAYEERAYEAGESACFLLP